MEFNNEAIASELISKNIRPSYQRIKILSYMKQNLFHPTVERIFSDLHEDIPSLSRTTIYNTMNLFIKAGLVKALNIEDNEIRYDIVMKSHGHFKCEECEAVFNFSINIDDFNTSDLGGFQIRDKNVYFKGVCIKCLNQNNKETNYEKEP